jgi:RNA polymerase sigma factor (sigma-70 family)
LRLLIDEMNLTASLKLLRDYADHGDEAAFRKLVEQYINLVYSVALRRVGGDASLAQDVTQAVFTDLARKAPSLRGVEYLGGWLHKHAGFVAANMVRSERRRQIREQEASQMNATDNSPDSLWQQLAPVLNDTIESLEPSDRQVILLRFFEQWDFRSIGTTLGISDDAAQKRVSRALDKVRIHFRRRGIVLSAVAIASVISANAVQAAPAGLASTVASASLAHAAGAWSFSLSSTYVQALFLKKTTYVLLLVALASALIIPISVFKARKSQSSAQVFGKDWFSITNLITASWTVESPTPVAREITARLTARNGYPILKEAACFNFLRPTDTSWSPTAPR